MIRTRVTSSLEVPFAVLLLACLAWGGSVAHVYGQVDPQLPGGQPGMVPTVPAAEPAPAIIDTAMAVLEIPESDERPVALYALQDTVLFGDILYLVLDFPGTLDPEPEVEVAGDSDWFVSEPVPEPSGVTGIFKRGSPKHPGLGDLPPVAGTRVVRLFRIYRTGPFRVGADSLVTAVLHVQGRTSGTDQVASIRAPRPVGWSPLLALALLVALILVILAGRLLWGQMQRREDPDDRIVPPPAWLAAVIELRDLLKQGSLNSDDSRTFLDGLAGISRRYVAQRYRIPAQEMTGREIIRSCGWLGHATSRPGAFGRMIDELDHRRYNPEAAPGSWCREQAIFLYEQISSVRVMPLYTDVPASLLRDGEAAWSEVDRELSPGGRPRRTSDAQLMGGPQ